MNYRIKTILASLAIIVLSGQLLAVKDTEPAKPKKTNLTAQASLADQWFKDYKPTNVDDAAEWACKEIECYVDNDVIGYQKIQRALTVFSDIYSHPDNAVKKPDALVFLLNHAYKKEYKKAKINLFFRVDSFRIYQAAFELGGEYKELATRVCNDEYEEAMDNVNDNDEHLKNNVLSRCKCLKKALAVNLPAEKFNAFWKKVNPEYLNKLLSKQLDYELIAQVQAYKFPVKQSTTTDIAITPLNN